MFKKYIILWLAPIISFSCGLEELPEYLHACPKNDPKAVDCIIQNIQRIQPILLNGVPELDIPSIEPLDLGDLLISERTRGLKISTKDLRVHGSSDFKLTKFTIERFGGEYHYDIFLPHLYVEGVYDIDGQILLFPIKGSGKFTGNFTSCSGSCKTILSTHSSDDEKVVISKQEIKIKFGNGSLKLESLFNDKVLGNAINDVINQNIEVLSKDFIPLIERSLERTFKKIGNNMAGRFTFGQLFPLN